MSTAHTPHLIRSASLTGFTDLALSVGLDPFAMMRKAGLTKEALRGRPDEVVTIAAKPARDTAKRLGWILRITYSDGHFYQLSGQ